MTRALDADIERAARALCLVMAKEDPDTVVTKGAPWKIPTPYGEVMTFPQGMSGPLWREYAELAALLLAQGWRPPTIQQDQGPARNA